MPPGAARERILAGLHERGYTGLVTAHLDVLQYPGPDDQRPSELAARTRMTRQALDHLLGRVPALGYQRPRRIRPTASEAIREIVGEVGAVIAAPADRAPRSGTHA